MVCVCGMLSCLLNQSAIVHFFLYSDPNVWPPNEYNTQNIAHSAAYVKQQTDAGLLGNGSSHNGYGNSTGWEPLSTKDNNYTSTPLARAHPQFVQHFELNDPIAAFVSVTGLVFALVFASNYTDAQCRLNEIRNSLAVEAGGVHTAMLLVRTLDDTDPGGNYKTRVLLLLASYIDHVSEEIEWQQRGSNIWSTGSSNGSNTTSGGGGGGGGEASPSDATPPPDSTVEILYATLPFLGEIAMDGDGDAMDHILVQRTVDSLKEASSARQIRITAEKRNISPWVYCFLWQMALVTFGGVLFLQTGSETLNSCVVGMTILSITSSMFILADLEKPYTGLVCVEVDIFNTIRNEIALVLYEKFTEFDPEEEEELGRNGAAAAAAVQAEHERQNEQGAGSSMGNDTDSGNVNKEAEAVVVYHRMQQQQMQKKEQQLQQLQLGGGYGSETDEAATTGHQPWAATAENGTGAAAQQQAYGCSATVGDGIAANNSGSPPPIDGGGGGGGAATALGDRLPAPYTGGTNTPAAAAAAAATAREAAGHPRTESDTCDGGQPLITSQCTVTC